MTQRVLSFGAGLSAAAAVGGACLVASHFPGRGEEAPAVEASTPAAPAPPETPEQRHQRLAAWLEQVGRLTPDENGRTKPPPDTETARARLVTAEGVARLTTDELFWALDHEMSKPTATTTGTMRLLLSTLGRRDGLRAIGWMKEHLNQHHKWDRCWRDVGAAWAMTDPRGLAEWYRAGKAAEVGDFFSVRASIVEWLAPEDIAMAARIACEESGISISNDSLAPSIRTPSDVHAVRSVLAEFPVSPADTLADGRHRSTDSPARRVQASLEKAWPSADPAGWEAFISTQPLGAYGENLWLGSHVRTLSSARDPAAVADQVWAQLPPGADRQAVVSAIVRGWSDSDPQAALNWAASHADEASLAGAASAAASRLATTDPAAALDLMSQVPASPSQVGQISSMFDRWHQQDAAAAEAFRARAGWSEEMERAIRERLLVRPNWKRSPGW